MYIDVDLLDLWMFYTFQIKNFFCISLQTHLRLFTSIKIKSIFIFLNSSKTANMWILQKTKDVVLKRATEIPDAHNLLFFLKFFVFSVHIQLITTSFHFHIFELLL